MERKGLVIGRRAGESMVFVSETGQSIARVTVEENKRGKLVLRIVAEPDIKIFREELITAKGK